ncbi:unnamed protein product [Amoebophrya sp. A25]|nr:unnamed protein product [Amoebophrya sp. A25]|eukprot:GSA25T00007432001.1
MKENKKINIMGGGCNLLVVLLFFGQYLRTGNGRANHGGAHDRQPGPPNISNQPPSSIIRSQRPVVQTSSLRLPNDSADPASPVRGPPRNAFAGGPGGRRGGATFSGTPSTGADSGGLGRSPSSVSLADSTTKSGKMLQQSILSGASTALPLDSLGTSGGSLGTSYNRGAQEHQSPYTSTMDHAFARSHSQDLSGFYESGSSLLFTVRSQPRLEGMRAFEVDGGAGTNIYGEHDDPAPPLLEEDEAGSKEDTESVLSKSSSSPHARSEASGASSRGTSSHSQRSNVREEQGTSSHNNVASFLTGGSGSRRGSRVSSDHGDQELHEIRPTTGSFLEDVAEEFGRNHSTAGNDENYHTLPGREESREMVTTATGGATIVNPRVVNPFSLSRFNPKRLLYGSKESTSRDSAASSGGGGSGMVNANSVFAAPMQQGRGVMSRGPPVGYRGTLLLSDSSDSLASNDHLQNLPPLPPVEELHHSAGTLARSTGSTGTAAGFDRLPVERTSMSMMPHASGATASGSDGTEGPFCDSAMYSQLWSCGDTTSAGTTSCGSTSRVFEHLTDMVNAATSTITNCLGASCSACGDSIATDENSTPDPASCPERACKRLKKHRISACLTAAAMTCAVLLASGQQDIRSGVASLPTRLIGGLPLFGGGRDEAEYHNDRIRDVSLLPLHSSGRDWMHGVPAVPASVIYRNPNPWDHDGATSRGVQSPPSKRTGNEEKEDAPPTWSFASKRHKGVIIDAAQMRELQDDIMDLAEFSEVFGQNGFRALYKAALRSWLGKRPDTFDKYFDWLTNDHDDDGDMWTEEEERRWATHLERKSVPPLEDVVDLRAGESSLQGTLVLGSCCSVLTPANTFPSVALHRELVDENFGSLNKGTAGDFTDALNLDLPNGTDYAAGQKALHPEQGTSKTASSELSERQSHLLFTDLVFAERFVSAAVQGVFELLLGAQSGEFRNRREKGPAALRSLLFRHAPGFNRESRDLLNDDQERWVASALFETAVKSERVKFRVNPAEVLDKNDFRRKNRKPHGTGAGGGGAQDPTTVVGGVVHGNKIYPNKRIEQQSQSFAPSNLISLYDRDDEGSMMHGQFGRRTSVLEDEADKVLEERPDGLGNTPENPRFFIRDYSPAATTAENKHNKAADKAAAVAEAPVYTSVSLKSGVGDLFDASSSVVEDSISAAASDMTRRIPDKPKLVLASPSLSANEQPPGQAPNAAGGFIPADNGQRQSSSSSGEASPGSANEGGTGTQETSPGSANEGDTGTQETGGLGLTYINAIDDVCTPGAKFIGNVVLRNLALDIRIAVEAKNIPVSSKYRRRFQGFQQSTFFRAYHRGFISSLRRMRSDVVNLMGVAYQPEKSGVQRQQEIEESKSAEIALSHWANAYLSAEELHNVWPLLLLDENSAAATWSMVKGGMKPKTIAELPERVVQAMTLAQTFNYLVLRYVPVTGFAELFVPDFLGIIQDEYDAQVNLNAKTESSSSSSSSTRGGGEGDEKHQGTTMDTTIATFTEAGDESTAKKVIASQLYEVEGGGIGGGPEQDQDAGSGPVLVQHGGGRSWETNAVASGSRQLSSSSDEVDESDADFQLGRQMQPTKRYAMQGAGRVLQWLQKYIYVEAVSLSPVLCGQAVLSGLRWALLGGLMSNDELQKLVYKL